MGCGIIVCIWMLCDGVKFFDNVGRGCVIRIIYIEINNIFIVLMCSYFEFSGDVKNIGWKVIDMCKVMFRVEVSYNIFRLMLVFGLFE